MNCANNEITTLVEYKEHHLTFIPVESLFVLQWLHNNVNIKFN